MLYHKELISSEYKASRKKDPFPPGEFAEVAKLMNAEAHGVGGSASDKSKAVFALIEFINWSGCRPDEAIQIFA